MTPTIDQVDDRIARAIDGVKELMRAHMQTQDAKLDAIIRRLDEHASLHDKVDTMDIRLIAVEAFAHAQEKRLGESRAYRKLHLPTIILASVGLLLGAAGTIATLINVL